jgi:hypothetical protein
MTCRLGWVKEVKSNVNGVGGWEDYKHKGHKVSHKGLKETW